VSVDSFLSLSGSEAMYRYLCSGMGDDGRTSVVFFFSVSRT